MKGFLRLLADGDVLKRAIQANGPAIAALGCALGAHPDVPAFCGDQREFKIPRSARVNANLHCSADERLRLWGVEIDRLGNIQMGGGIDLMDAIDLLGPAKGLRFHIQFPAADLGHLPGEIEQVM